MVMKGGVYQTISGTSQIFDFCGEWWRRIKCMAGIYIDFCASADGYANVLFISENSGTSPTMENGGLG